MTLDFINEIKEQHIMLDTSIVMRVYENLISNAIRYAKGIIYVRLWCTEGIFCFDVTDDGQGFSKEDLQFAMKPYYRRKANAEELHFGLGLYICKTLCEKHGGTIAIENAQNGGAVATASFSVK